jgi:ribosome-binding protein aMBF1 (putative translation factor)
MVQESSMYERWSNEWLAARIKELKADTARYEAERAQEDRSTPNPYRICIVSDP